MAHVSRLDPGLDQARVREVIQQAIPQPFQHHQVLWELDQHPGLLTGQGADGSPRINAVISGRSSPSPSPYIGFLSGVIVADIVNGVLHLPRGFDSTVAATGRVAAARDRNR